MLSDEADLGNYDTSLVSRVVAELVDAGVTDPSRLLLVGAHCRNVWATALGHEGQVRRTNDVDLGFVVTDLADYDEVTGRLSPWPQSSNGIAYDVAGVPVDLMPFGPDVEEPPGEVTPRRRHGQSFNVIGFDDVHAAAVPLRLGGLGIEVRIPTPEGLTALKVAAWHDRIAHHDNRDASDLAAVLSWYLESPAVADRFWGSDDLIDAAAGEPWTGAAMLWGIGTRAVLSHDVAARIAELWLRSRSDLPRYLLAAHYLPGDELRLVETWVDGFEAGLTGEVTSPTAP